MLNIYTIPFWGKAANACAGLISALLLLFNVSPIQTNAPVADNSGYKLCFSEEFDGDTLNTERWNPHTGEGVRKGGYWDMSQVTVEDGCLHIRTQYKDGKFGGGWYTGAVDTKNKFEQAYGYYECRCILPKGQGLWSAFWLMNDNVNNSLYRSGKRGAEIDVFESPFYFRGGTDKNIVTTNIHYGGYSVLTRYQNVAITEISGDPYKEFNTYALKWTPDSYTFYINGKEIGKTSFGGVSESPEYMILSVEIDGATGTPSWGWSGSLENESKTGFNSDFIVDYVRVYTEK